MRITSSTVGMSSNTSEIYAKSQNYSDAEVNITDHPYDEPAAIISISDEGKNELENLSNNSQQIDQLGQASDSQLMNSKEELTQNLIEGALTALSNRSFNFIKTTSSSNYFGKNYADGSASFYKNYEAGSVELSLTDIENVNANFSFVQEAPYTENSSTRSTKGNFTMEDKETTLTYSEAGERIQSETYDEQNLSFKAQVFVQTESGKTTSLGLSVNVSREFYEKLDETSIKFEKTMQKLVDPLVINFDASSAELSDTKFSFDLDCDGTSDQISKLAKGSGFLALDKNNDGQINDGSELFGTQSGDGFADLAVYDTDKNGWIDEGDEIFDKLRIWTMDEDGNNQLVGLGEKGVGAIYLGNVNTDYTLKSSDNELNGMIRQTGIFLRENFTAGTIQHVDFALGENSSGLSTAARENFTEGNNSKAIENMPQIKNSAEIHVNENLNIKLQTNNYKSVDLSSYSVKSTIQTQKYTSEDVSKEMKKLHEESKMQIEQFKRILSTINYQKRFFDMKLHGVNKLYITNQFIYNYFENKNSVFYEYKKGNEDSEKINLNKLI